jgi:hypothetical protein
MGFKPCELRRPWLSEWTDGEAFSRWFCEAAGRPLEELAEPGESQEDVCARCPIPEELSRRPCLFMVPVKLHVDGERHEFFGCHWYHTIMRPEFQQDTFQCEGCRDWFPRPPVEVNYRYQERTAKMIRHFEHVLTAPPDPPRREWRWEAPPPVPVWRRAWHRIVAWVWI